MKNYKRSLGKMFLILSFVALAIFLYLIFHKGNADQKISEERRNDLTNEKTMADSVLVPEAGKISDGNSEANVAPEEKSEAVTPPEENKTSETIVDNSPKTSVLETKKDTVKTTAKVKAPMAVAPKKSGSTEISCKHKNDHTSKSKTKGKHMDEDCCPDPDEWAKPDCVYSQKGLALMLSGPSKKKK